MLLSKALGIRERDIVCFVGAGGKTLAAMQAARERAAQSRRTLVTATTRILEPAPGPGETLVLASSLADCLEKVHLASAHFPTIVLAKDAPREGPVSLSWLGNDYPLTFKPYKLTGIPTDWVAPLAAQEAGEVILIEADGAAHRMLKAPNPREPVIPPNATLVVPMADMDVLGKPLGEEVVHRPVLLADMACVPMGAPISAEMIAIALAHPQGGLKSAPAGARVVPLLTTHRPSFDSPDILKTIQLLLLSPSIQRVVVAYLRSTPVACELCTR